MGAALGAGQAFSARLAARASLLAVPVVWVMVAALLLEPNSQKGILWLFTKVRLCSMLCPLNSWLSRAHTRYVGVPVLLAQPMDHASQGDDVELVNRLRHLLDLVVVLVLLTGLQAILAGIIAVRLPVSAVEGMGRCPGDCMAHANAPCLKRVVQSTTADSTCRALQSRRRVPLQIWWHSGLSACPSVRLHVLYSQ